MEGGHHAEAARDLVVRVVDRDRGQLAGAEDLAEAGHVDHHVHPGFDVEGLDERVVVGGLRPELGVGEQHRLAARLYPGPDHLRRRRQEVVLRSGHDEDRAVRGHGLLPRQHDLLGVVEVAGERALDRGQPAVVAVVDVLLPFALREADRLLALARDLDERVGEVLLGVVVDALALSAALDDDRGPGPRWRR